MNIKTKNNQGRIVLGVTGSIAAYKSAELIRRLQEKGHDVTVVMTKEAARFIAPLTLATLSGKKVLSDLFDNDGSAWQMNHIQQAEADVLLIAPATANTIGKIAAGIADDLLTCLVLATKSKIMIAPAMNVEMFKNKIVQQNIKRLKDAGVEFIDPVEGKLACGVFGEGHLADIETIIGQVDRYLKTKRG